MSRRFTVALNIPKCVRCQKSVYPQEEITYDGTSYHNFCFKCLNCKATMSLGQVAQINKELYCKNCFKRIFSKEGKYTSFDTLKRETVTPQAGNSIPSPTALADRPAPPVRPAPMSPSSATPQKTLLKCLVSGCERPRAHSSRMAYCSDHTNSALSDEKELTQFFEYITAKNVDKVKELIAQKGVEYLWKQNSQGTCAIETAFRGLVPPRACGMVMIDAIKNHIQELKSAQGVTVGKSLNNNADTVISETPPFASG